MPSEELGPDQASNVEGVVRVERGKAQNRFLRAALSIIPRALGESWLTCSKTSVTISASLMALNCADIGVLSVRKALLENLQVKFNGRPTCVRVYILSPLWLRSRLIAHRGGLHLVWNLLSRAGSVWKYARAQITSQVDLIRSVNKTNCTRHSP